MKKRNNEGLNRVKEKSYDCELFVLCRYSLLTLASEAICHLIYPFRWQVNFFLQALSISTCLVCVTYPNFFWEAAHKVLTWEKNKKKFVDYNPIQLSSAT